jgi:hypothetical protein
MRKLFLEKTSQYFYNKNKNFYRNILKTNFKRLRFEKHRYKNIGHKKIKNNNKV